jgi:hypothetical protein
MSPPSSGPKNIPRKKLQCDNECQAELVQPKQNNGLTVPYIITLAVPLFSGPSVVEGVGGFFFSYFDMHRVRTLHVVALVSLPPLKFARTVYRRFQSKKCGWPPVAYS